MFSYNLNWLDKIAKVITNYELANLFVNKHVFFSNLSLNFDNNNNELWVYKTQLSCFQYNIQ